MKIAFFTTLICAVAASALNSGEIEARRRARAQKPVAGLGSVMKNKAASSKKIDDIVKKDKIIVESMEVFKKTVLDRVSSVEKEAKIPGKDGAPGPSGHNGRDGRDGAQGVKGDKGDDGLGLTLQPFQIGKKYQEGDYVFHQGRKGGDAMFIAQGSFKALSVPSKDPTNWLQFQAPRGRPGEKGESGAPGVDGKDGRPGVDGKQGRIGKDGKPGEDGRPGVDGKQGSRGPSGGKGDKGDDGENGPMGPTGKDGAPGTRGPRGEQGATGVRGELSRDDVGYNMTGPCNVYKGSGAYKGYQLLASNRGGGVWNLGSHKYVTNDCTVDSKESCVNPEFLNFHGLKGAEIMEEYKLQKEGSPRYETYKWDKDTLSESPSIVQAYGESNHNFKLKLWLGSSKGPGFTKANSHHGCNSGSVFPGKFLGTGVYFLWQSYFNCGHQNGLYGARGSWPQCSACDRNTRKYGSWDLTFYHKKKSLKLDYARLWIKGGRCTRVPSRCPDGMKHSYDSRVCTKDGKMCDIGYTVGRPKTGLPSCAIAGYIESFKSEKMKHEASKWNFYPCPQGMARYGDGSACRAGVKRCDLGFVNNSPNSGMPHCESAIPKSRRGKSCDDIKKRYPSSRSGLYFMDFREYGFQTVRCVMDSKEGWTMIFATYRKESSATAWALNWDTVTKKGFRHGNPPEHGNYLLPMSLWRYFHTIKLISERSGTKTLKNVNVRAPNYELSFDKSGDKRLDYHRGMKLSTVDRDQDEYKTSCASRGKTFGWYKTCCYMCMTTADNVWPSRGGYYQPCDWDYKRTEHMVWWAR